MNVWCKDPFVHIDIVVENDQIKYYPCNVYQFKFNDSNFNNVKNNLLSGQWAPGCSYCKIAESSGLNSRRIGVNKLKENLDIKHGIQSIGLRYGTLCNSTCLICDETRSSAWASHKTKNLIPIQPQFNYKKSTMPNVKELLSKFDLPKIKFIEFHGGEPLINSYPWETLKLLNKSELYVKINTNGTVWPDRMLEFTDCKSTEIMFSVDDIYNRLEFLRPPAEFNIILENIQKSKELKFKTSCIYTMSSLNIFYLPEFLDWALKVFGIRIHGQHLFNNSNYALYNLSPYAKKSIEEKFLKFPKLSKLLDIAINELKKPKQCDDLDLREIARSEKFKKTFPEWAEILNYD